MKLAALLVVLGTTTAASADDRDICLARRHALEAQLRESPPSAQVALEKELPICEPDTPPLSAGRVTGEAMLGGALGVGGAFAGAMIGYELTSGGCKGEDWCGFGGFLIGGAIGGTIAVPLGVYIVGSYGDQTGSLAATVGGAVLGAAVGIPAGIAVGNENGELGLAVALAGPVVGAIAGFNLTRHYRATAAPAVGSLLQLDRGRLGLGVPVVTRSAKDGFVGMSLASGSF